MKMILVTMRLKDGYPKAEKMVPVYLPENTEDDINGWLDAHYDVELSVNITREIEGVKEDDF